MVHTAGIVSYSTIAKGDVDNFDKIIGWVVISDSGVNKDLAQNLSARRIDASARKRRTRRQHCLSVVPVINSADGWQENRQEQAAEEDVEKT